MPTFIEWIFFILADAEYYFIYHIDVWQGNNTERIEIHPSIHNLPTTNKAVSDAIIKSKIENYSHGYRHLYMENIYAAPQLFSLVDSNYILR